MLELDFGQIFSRPYLSYGRAYGMVVACLSVCLSICCLSVMDVLWLNGAR